MVYAGWLNQHARMDVNKAKRKTVRVCLGCGVSIAGHGNKKRCSPCAHDMSQARIQANRKARAKLTK